MYLARFSTDVEDWVQAVAVIDSAPPQSRGSDSVFWDEIARRLSAAARIPRSTVARRIAVDRRRRLRQTVAVTAPAAQERSVRQVIAGLTRLESITGGVLALPHGREEHDAWLERPGPYRFCSTADGFSVRGVPLACDFRLAAALDELLLDACLGGHELTYQLHVRAAEPDPEWVRAARKNVLALQELPGARPALVEWQEQLARAFGYASAFCEEYLVVDSPDAAESASALLAEHFQARYGPLGFTAPPARFREDAYDEPLALAIHSHDLDPLSPVDLCGTAAAAAERDQLLGWRPSPRMLHLLAPAEEEGNGEEGPASLPPAGEARGGAVAEPYTGAGPFAFVSYKRQDLHRIAPIVDKMRELGVPVWYDRGIPGGAEWDEVIEDRLARARFVLLCASRAAVESKYVRREVKFADALDIPLLCVLLEDEVPLAHGMRMLLMQYQMLNAGSTDFSERLRLAVAHLA